MEEGKLSSGSYVDLHIAPVCPHSNTHIMHTKIRLRNDKNGEMIEDDALISISGLNMCLHGGAPTHT